MGLKLYAPEPYWMLSKAERSNFSNGCGASGWKCDIIADNFFIGGWFKSEELKGTCDIHDYMYATGNTLEDKEKADRVFLNNMLRVIDESGAPKIIKMFRRWQAKSYYESVKAFGGAAFWKDKNKPQELGEA